MIERRKQRQLAEIGFERKKALEAESQRKAEKHELAQEVGKLKKQLMEIRVAKHYMAELRRIKPQGPAREQEFELVEAKSAA